MKILIILVCISFSAGSAVWLGERFDVMTAFLLSFIGRLAGVYAGVPIKREYMP
jgi:hypothetical protein